MDRGLLASYQAPVLSAAAAAAVEADFREPELVGIVPGTESRQTPWQRFQNQVTLPSTGLIDIAALLDGDDETELRSSPASATTGTLSPSWRHWPPPNLSGCSPSRWTRCPTGSTRG